MRKLLAILLLTAALLPLHAQELEWSVDANALVNNREGGDEATPDQTFLFTRLTPHIGVSIDSAQHRIMAGATWYQPFDGDWKHGKVEPLLHYEWNVARGDNRLALKVGMFERDPHAGGERLPYYLWSDSLQYRRHVVKGIDLQYWHRHGLLAATLDWQQMQTRHHREAFDITLHHVWQPAPQGPFFTNTYIRYNHLAKRKDAPDGEGVNDNIIVNPMLGVTLPARPWNEAHASRRGKPLATFSLQLQAGLLLACDRARFEDKWHTPAGFVARATARWKWFELEENFYAGQRQMPLYDLFGSALYLGDQHYHNKTYSRTDLNWQVVTNDIVALDAKLTFHASSSCTAFWQQVSVRFNLDNHKLKARRAGSVASAPLDIISPY